MITPQQSFVSVKKKKKLLLTFVAAVMQYFIWRRRHYSSAIRVTQGQWRTFVKGLQSPKSIRKKLINDNYLKAQGHSQIKNKDIDLN